MTDASICPTAAHLIQVGFAEEDFGGLLPRIDVRLFDRMERRIGKELMRRDRLEGTTAQTRDQSVGRAAHATARRQLQGENSVHVIYFLQCRFHSR